MDRFRGHHERMPELLQREQQPGESADDYIHSMQQVASRLKTHGGRTSVGVFRSSRAPCLLAAEQVDEVDEQRNLEVDELRGRVRNPFRPGFLNCGAAEHGFQDCEATEGRRFCFRCGRPCVISSKCPEMLEFREVVRLQEDQNNSQSYRHKYL